MARATVERSRGRRRLGAIAALVVVVCLALLAQGLSPEPPRVAQLPDTTDGIHVGLPFLQCYKETWFVGPSNSPGCNESARTPVTALRSQPVDVGWMWTYGYYTPAQTGAPEHFGASFSYDRTPGWEVSRRDGSAVPIVLDDWRSKHPDWIVYRCPNGGEKQPAWEYQDVPARRTDPAYIPFDITNPAAREYMWRHYYRPSLEAGYTMLFFDNVSLVNFAYRCGHYNRGGDWIQQYAPDGSDAAKFRHDVLDWLSFLRDRIHGYDNRALLAVNYNPSPTEPDAPQVYERVDLVWNEAGFTNWGGRRDTLDRGWEARAIGLEKLAQRPDKALIVNGTIRPPGRPKDAHAIKPDDRAWVLANYLLVKGARTYFAITTFDYGYYTDFPEYHLPIGRPTEDMQRDGALALRHFTGGIAIVNPDGKSAHEIAFPAGSYRSLSGAPVERLSLAPASGIVLLKSRGG